MKFRPRIREYMLAVVCVFGAAVAHAGSTERILEATLSALAAHSPLPGFCVAVVDASGRRYLAGFGYADIATRRPYTSGTVQEVASISKTLIGVAVMQAVEEGLLTLDEDLRPLLPFEVSNPRFPDAPIALAELATHTNEGVFWQFSAHGEIGHAGGDPGVSTFIFFDPKSGVGRILIANVGNDGVRPAVGKALQAVWTALGAYARSSGPNAELQGAAH